MKEGITYIGGKAYKKCKVVMLPTNQKIEHNKTFLWKDSISKQLFYKPIRLELTKVPRIQHLYIISDEEIKEGDYYYDKEDNIFFKCLDKQEAKARNDAREIYEIDRWFKIIATTDSLLGLPRPSDDFIKKYCEVNGNISDILVEYESKCDWHLEGCKGSTCCSECPLVIKIAKDNTITIKPIKNSWNREEVIELFNRFYATDMVYEKLEKSNFDKWIEENL